MQKIIVLFIVLFIAGTSSRAVDLNSLFSDNVVLQQNKPLPVWGTGREGEKITVKLDERTATATVSGGKWSVQLDALPAGGPLTLTVTGDNTLTVTNVLVGEVWVCSGQSNMERQLGLRSGQKPIENWEQEVAAADHPQNRMFFVHVAKSQTPLADARGQWVVCSPQTVKDFSAVGYFFAQALQAHLKVPVGMIFTSVGGTAIELWTSPEALAKNPAGAELIRKNEEDIREFPEKLGKFKAEEPALLEKFTNDLTAAKLAGKSEPRKPSAPRDPVGVRPGCLFNGMVAPLMPYALRGVIWYQGESNGGRGKQYRELFPLMIHDWRNRWQQGSFPFCFVQIATYRSADPMIREAQFLTLSRVPDSAMVVTTDIGDASDIHPTRKRPVGERLALAARAIAYGDTIEFSGPLFESSEIKDGKVICHFSHAQGLKAKDGVLTGFVVAGADKKFVPADAVIQDATVVASSPKVPAPVVVRYNWAGVAEGNLYNAAGLPASPFRTDVESDEYGNWLDVMPPTDLKGWTRIPIPPTNSLGRAQWHLDAEHRGLVCDGDGGHEMLRFDRELSNCTFHVECRFMPVTDPKATYNSGIFIRNSADGIVWHQCQLTMDGGYLFGNTPTEGTLKRFKSPASEKRMKVAGEWNEVDVTAKGQTLTVVLNGAEVSEFTHCETSSGYIALESEGYAIEFRNLKLRELP